MRHRLKWIFPVVLGVLLLAGTAIWGYNQMVARKAAETALNNKYNLAFYNLVNNIQNIEVMLSKTLVGEETWQDTQLFSQLWREANAAQSNLGQIPVSDITVSQTIKFLNQVGAYSQVLGVQTAAGMAKNNEQWQTLHRLYRQTRQLSSEMNRVEGDLSSGRLMMSELKRDSQSVLRKQGPRLADTNFRVMDRSMQQFPTLIYDGPFSDHLAKKKPLGLTGSQVNADQARSKALAFIDQQPNVTYIANVVRKDNGRLPVYSVEVVPRPSRNGETITMGVSQQAGQVIWMVNSKNIEKARITVAQAMDKAMRFLQNRGFKDLESTYYETRNNMVIFNFAATQGGVILYPDLIKVSVALDNGQVLGVDATNYWMSHRVRQLPDPKLTVSQARAKLSPRLQDVTPGRLALIPKTVDREELTYEFQGRLDNDVFLIYIDAVTGEEERVLRVIKTNNGVLTM